MKNLSADGLRGLAALNVAISHFIAAFIPTMLHKNHPSLFSENESPSLLFNLLTSPIASIFYNGHFAVLIFFVLSGYVLTLPYFENPVQSKQILARRLLGRYLRLNIPIAAAIGISFIFYNLNLYTNIKAADLSGSTQWFNLYFKPGLTPLIALKEMLYESIILGKGQFLPPVWTLKIEFIGSLYILFFYLFKPKNRTWLSGLIAFVLLYLIHRENSIYFYAIFCGSFLSQCKPKLALRIILFLSGIYFGGFQFESYFYNFLPDVVVWEKKTFYNTIGAIFLTVSVVQGFGVPFFTSKPIQFLGKISFSMYLLHFIILCSVSSYFYMDFDKAPLSLASQLLAYLFLCLLASKIFEQWVDRPAIKISHQFASSVSK